MKSDNLKLHFQTKMINSDKMNRFLAEFSATILLLNSADFASKCEIVLLSIIVIHCRYGLIFGEMKLFLIGLFICWLYFLINMVTYCVVVGCTNHMETGGQQAISPHHPLLPLTPPNAPQCPQCHLMPPIPMPPDTPQFSIEVITTELQGRQL